MNAALNAAAQTALDARASEPVAAVGAAVEIGRYSRRLQQDAEGIWRAGPGAAVSYPEHGHAACLQVEDSSFWFRHRNRCIVAAAGRHLGATDGPIFDVGGGNGFVARGLQEAGFKVVLVEPGPQGARNARRRGLPHVICATTESCGFEPRSLPAIGLFDVVEHIEGDVAFLSSLAGALVAGGRVLLTVPAHGWLWSGEDVAAGHFRRYTQASITAALRRAGFRVDYITGIFRPLIVPILMMRAVPFRLGLRPSGARAVSTAREHGVDDGPMARAIAFTLAGEVKAVAKGRSIAHGASILVVASLPA